MTFIRILIRSIFLFEHDLPGKRSRLSRGKTGSHFPDHALAEIVTRCTPARPIAAQAAPSDPQTSSPAAALDDDGVEAEPARVHGE